MLDSPSWILKISFNIWTRRSRKSLHINFYWNPSILHVFFCNLRFKKLTYSDLATSKTQIQIFISIKVFFKFYWNPDGSEINFAQSSWNYLRVTDRSRSPKSQRSVIDWSHYSSHSKITRLTSDNVQFANQLSTDFRLVFLVYFEQF